MSKSPEKNEKEYQNAYLGPKPNLHERIKQV